MRPNINRSVETDIHLPDPAGTKVSHSVEKELPRSGHRIQIEAREGVFVVLRTHVERGTVDVLRISGMRQIEAGIPLASVHILHSQNPGDLFEKLDG